EGHLAAMEQQVVADPAVAHDRVPALDALDVRVRLHADNSGDALGALDTEALELEPDVARPLVALDAPDEIPAHVFGCLCERVELAGRDVAVEGEGQEQLERLCLPGGVVTAEQQAPAGQLEHLIAVFVQIEDAGADEPEAIHDGHPAPATRTSGARKRPHSG